MVAGEKTDAATAVTEASVDPTPGQSAGGQPTAKPVHAGVPAASPTPTYGPAGVLDSSAPDGPFSTRQLMRIDEALSAADRETGLSFSVYVGTLDEDSRAHAGRLLDQLPAPTESILIAVGPNEHKLEIVTGEHAMRRLPDRVCALASLSMTAAFSGGDLTGGIVTGIRMLTDQALVG